MNVISAHNPKYTVDGGIDLLVRFDMFPNEDLPFHATQNDPEAHGRELYTMAISGKYGVVTPYTPPVIPIGEIAAAKLTAINNGKNTALDGGFTHNGILFDSDSKARLAYLELGFKLNTAPTYSTPWKASTGQWTLMDAALFTSLQPAYEAHIQSCFAWQGMKEQEVALALANSDIEALKAISETM